MATSTNLLRGIIPRAFHFFELPSCKSLEVLSSNQTKSILKAHAVGGSKYVVHIRQASSLDTTDNEVSIHDQLSLAGIVSPLLIADNAGKYQYIEDNISVRISPWIEGRHASSFNVSKDDCFTIGTALGVFHDSVTRLPQDQTSTLLEKNVEDWWKTHRILHANDKADDLWGLARKFKAKGVPTGIIHGDIHVYNLLLNNGSVAFLDFEHSTESYFIFDIARAVTDICSDGDRFSLEKNRRFIEGYERSRKLTEAEHCMYLPSVAYATLCVADWFVANDNPAMASHFLEIGTDAAKVL